MIFVRATQAEEITAVSALLAQSWKSAYRGLVDDAYLDALPGNHWVSFLDAGRNERGSSTVVLEQDGELAGAAILRETGQPGEICLLSFYLAPDKFGQGLGDAFYQELEGRLRHGGYSRCVLDVLEGNRRAIRFYLAHGFQETGRGTEAVLAGRKYPCKTLEKLL